MSPSEVLVQARNLLLGSGSVGQLTIIAGVIGAALLLLVVFLRVAKSSDPSGRLEGLLRDRAESSRSLDTSVWAVRLLVTALFIGAFAAANIYAARPSTCAQCHRTDTYAESLEQSPHAEISCMRCHMPAGVTGLAVQGVNYTRWMVVYGVTKKAPDPKAGSVGDGSCLRCHDAVARETVTAHGIRVRHSDFLEAGAECRDCHNSTAHPNVVKEPSTPSMDRCLPCHDGTTAPSDCETCHVRDTALRPLSERGYVTRTSSGTPDSCYKCHDQGPCLSCHGVTMPHPAGWSPNERGTPGYGHAREGFANREVCWRCHYSDNRPFVPSDEACSCHGLLGKVHGGEPWIKEHGLEATGQRSGANADCFACHSTDLCDRCHPPSYRQRFAPNGAAPVTPGYKAPDLPELQY